MKKIVITNYGTFGDMAEVDPSKKNIVAEGDESMDAHDGYHTFTELYEHRVTLFIALCRKIIEYGSIQAASKIWRSKRHHPTGGPMYEDSFIMGINTEPGQQISYHLPMSKWSETGFVLPENTLEHAPIWDGHSPEEALHWLRLL